MNYQKIYDSLIDRAKNRILINVYVEKHHIIPKCVGGTNYKDNIVELMSEEHYVAHQLLVKIYEKLGNTFFVKKLLFALNLMSGKSNINRNNKYYGWIRKEVSNSRIGNITSDETRKLISINVKRYFKKNGHHLKGVQLSIDHKNKISMTLSGRKILWGSKISKSLIGNPKSEEHRKQFQGKNNPNYKLVSQSEQLDIIKDFIAGMRFLDLIKKYNYGEAKLNLILKENNIDPTIRTCPHCGKIGQTSNMIRWHFDNCKNKV